MLRSKSMRTWLCGCVGQPTAVFVILFPRALMQQPRIDHDHRAVLLTHFDISLNMVLILCALAKNKRNKAQIYSHFWSRFDGIVYTTSSSMLSLNKPCDSCNTNNLYRSPSSTCRVYMRACTIARNQANGMFDIVLDARARAHACLSVLVNR